MAPLRDTLLEPSRRPQVVTDLVQAVDAEVASLGGMSGAAAKAGFKAVRRMSPNLLQRAVNAMLPQWADALDPLWLSRGDQAFSEQLMANASAAADALLSVTDARVALPQHAAVARIYAGLRPRAKNQVIAALPRVGQVIESYAH